MNINIVAVAGLLLLIAPLHAEPSEHVHDPHTMETTLQNDAPIQVKINPEARVSVTLVGTLPPPSPCGVPAELTMKIVNEGFVTARLEAQLVGYPPPGVTLDLDSQALKGVPQEIRSLRITLRKATLADLTIAFRTHDEIPDLGGRDRIHFLLRCRGPLP